MKTIVIFGDSYVAAADRGRPGFARLTPLLMLRRGSHMGRGGTGFVKENGTRLPYPDRLPELLDRRADLTLVQVSGNDAPCDLRAVERAAEDFLCRLIADGRRAVVLGPMWAIEGRDNLSVLRDTVRLVCERCGVPFIDALGWVGPSMMGPDGAHPNLRGHAVVAWRLAVALRSLRH